MCSPMVICSSLLRATNLRQGLATIAIHMVSKVLRVLLGLVEVHTSWPAHLELSKKERKKKDLYASQHPKVTKCNSNSTKRVTAKICV
jgi:hypothetical protein